MAQRQIEVVNARLLKVGMEVFPVYGDERSGWSMDPIDLLVIVSDCHTAWPQDAPPFPVITIRVGDGAPPPWGNRGGNTVISIEDSRG